jgi:hypothetical protein
MSGKDAEAQPEKVAQKSSGVTDDGIELLKKRGNLTQEQIHALAHKGKKADCHSDNVANSDDAKLVQVNTLKAHGVTVNESGL